ncbi:hypothetical protein GCM10010211_85520 [Streptomyces albospinus]|uniref:Uncharacterized protein n=1 Tax=Streptomyces albospinus TaxID=285515 RepID=A0ABQ2VRX5_9ACTN|nr:hypothetical protein [Streptomyces albospinus]GGV05559.1 hypothetical protein GCM10010211_85520 [Streptomyces albospinus]
MSGWQAYVKVMTDATSAIKQGAIIDKPEGDVLGKLPDSAAITLGEGAAMSKAFADLETCRVPASPSPESST